MEKFKLEFWSLERFVRYARRLRKNEVHVEKMMQSIREFGFRVPVLAMSDGEVVDGDLRLQAAERLGMASVPVVLADGLSPAQVKAFRLMANSSAAWANWDEQGLGLELQELRALEFDLELTGLDLSICEDLLEQLRLAGDERDPDAVPESGGPWVTEPGDLWTLGEHRLLCGDSTSVRDVERLMNGELADMVFTDPPYNVNYEGKAGKIRNDHMAAEDFYRFLYDAYTTMFLHLKKGGPIYVAHGESEGVAFRRAFEDVGFKLASCVIWVKNQFVIGRSDYQPQHEPILYGWKPGARHCWFGGRKRTTSVQLDGDVVQVEDDGLQLNLPNRILRVCGRDLGIEELVPSVVFEKKPLRSDDHPTMKPVALVERFLLNSCKRGELVLDPFGGSGSTLMACETNARRCRTMELDPRFADVIVRRWQEFTGRQARLDGSGMTFAEKEARQ